MKTYKATFRDGRTANYSEAVLNDLMLDYDVDEIMDNETGELLKLKNDEGGHEFLIHINHDEEDDNGYKFQLNIFGW